MSTAERINHIRIIEKMDSNKEYAKKIGLRDMSEFRKSQKHI